MNIFDRLFRSRQDTPIIPPVELTMGGPPVDPPEEMIAGDGAVAARIGALEDIAGLSFVINYKDSSGEMSLRAVTCRAIDRGPPETLRAFCHLRDDERRFRIGRIRQIVELGTGDVMEGDELRDFLAPYMAIVGGGDPAENQRHFQYLAGPAVQILVFVAAADGMVHPTEQNVILEFAAAEAGRLMPGRSFDRQATARWIRNLKPTRAAARDAVGRLAEDEDRVAAFSAALIRLVRADGVIDADEADATREIVASIRQARQH